MDSQNKHFIGVDIAKATLEVAFDDTRKTASFGNDEAGIAALLARHLCAAGFPVVVVNPRQAHDFVKAMGNMAKTDRMDAQALSLFARTLHSSGRFEKMLLRLPDEQQDELAALVTRRAQLVEMRVAESNRLELSHRLQAKSIKTVIKTLDKQIQALDVNCTPKVGHLSSLWGFLYVEIR